jgi:subfamily B ATP-binding cassette protein HlyB/CyaB
MRQQQNASDGTERRSTSVTALTRVAAHHGLNLNPDQLIRANPFEGNEPSAALLLKMARRVGLSGEILQLEPGELARLARSLPAILLLPGGKATLLTRIQHHEGADLALLEDLESSEGMSLLVEEPRLFQVWSGEALVLKRRWRITDEERPFGFTWLVGQIIQERRLFRDIGIAAFLLSLLALFPPITFMILLDRVLYNHSFATLWVLGTALLLAITFDTLFGYLRRYLVLLASSRIDARINVYVFDKLLNLPMSFFERMPTGRINAKIGQIWHIRQFLIGQVFGTMVDSIMLFVLLPILFALNWRLSLLVLVLALCIMGVYIVYLPALHRRHQAVVEAEQNMGAHQVETIYGIRTVKSLSLDGLKRHQRDLLVVKVVEAHQALDRLANMPQTLVTPLERLIYGGSFFLGCYMALGDPTGSTAGTIVAFAMLAGRVVGPITQFAGLLNGFEHARGALGEVASVMNVPPEEGRSGTGLTLPVTGRVAFKDVRFRYPSTTAYALDGVSFEIPAGTLFGVMGRSGSGKTTVTRLLQGLNREYEGLIKLDSMDLREMDLDHLRSHIGVVPQENFLFSGTVRENIGAARPNASFEKIVRAAQLAGAEEFIERLPKGYETVVEEGAVNFSGGQRQRLAIARALLVDPPILVLDEATSALDAESEAIVNANLMRIAQDRTVIIISHRLSSLVMADAIMVLERGKLYDVGRHEELLERCDIYKSLWYQQNRHLDPEARYASPAARPTSAA